MTRKIREVMTAGPVCLTRSEAVTQAARLMREQGIGCVLVEDAGELRGILTDRDIAVRVLAEGLDPATTKVGDVCSADLVTIGPDDDVTDAVQLIRERAIRRLPVVQAGTPVGMVSIGDLARESGDLSALAGISIAPPNV